MKLSGNTIDISIEKIHASFIGCVDFFLDCAIIAIGNLSEIPDRRAEVYNLRVDRQTKCRRSI